MLRGSHCACCLHSVNLRRCPPIGSGPFPAGAGPVAKQSSERENSRLFPQRGLVLSGRPDIGRRSDGFGDGGSLRVSRQASQERRTGPAAARLLPSAVNTAEADMAEEAEELLARITGKVMMLEASTALLLVGVLGDHPDPLAGLAAFESAIDRERKSLPPDLPQAAHDAAADTANVLIRQGQAFLDLSEEDRARGAKPE